MRREAGECKLTKQYYGEVVEGVDIQFAPVRVKSKNVKYKNDIFGHMPVCPVLVPCVSRLPPVSFYR